MATELKLLSAQTNNIGSTYFDMTTATGAAAANRSTTTTVAGTQIQLTATQGGAVMQWVSGAAGAGFTLTSTNVSVGAKESATGVNAGLSYRVFRREPNGTETELGGGPFAQGTELSTSTVTRAWTGNVTDTAFNAGDRILLKLYAVNQGTMSSGAVALTHNGASGTAMSWFNIAETVTFLAPATIPSFPPKSTAAFTGQAPTIGVSISVPGLELSLSGQLPVISIAADIVRTPAAGALTVIGQTPIRDATAFVALDSYDLTPEVGIPVVIAPGAGAMSFIGQAPTTQVLEGFVVAPAAAALTFTGLVPVVSSPVVVSVGERTLALSGQAPELLETNYDAIPQFTVGSAILAQPAPGSLAIAGRAPSLSLVISPATGTLSIAGQAPAVIQTRTALPAAATLQLTGTQPSVVEVHTRQPAAGVLTLVGNTPVVIATSLIPVGAGALAFTPRQPAIAATDDHAISVAAGALSITAYAANASLAYSASPATVVALFSGQVPLVSIGKVVQPSVGVVSITGYVPSVEVDYVIAVAAGALAIEEQTPKANDGEIVRPAMGVLQFAGVGPSFGFNLHIYESGAGALAITGEQPVIILYINPPRVGRIIYGKKPARVVYDVPKRRKIA